MPLLWNRGEDVLLLIDPLLPVPEETVNPVTDAWVDVHVQ